MDGWMKWLAGVGVGAVSVGAGFAGSLLLPNAIARRVEAVRNVYGEPGSIPATLIRGGTGIGVTALATTAAGAMLGGKAAAGVGLLAGTGATIGTLWPQLTASRLAPAEIKEPGAMSDLMLGAAERIYDEMDELSESMDVGAMDALEPGAMDSLEYDDDDGYDVGGYGDEERFAAYNGESNLFD